MHKHALISLYEHSNVSECTPELDKLIRSFESKVFKSITEPARAQIIKFLLLNGRSDISTIASHLPQDRSVISRHLNMMAEAGILFATKETRHMYYSINCRTFLEEFKGITREILDCMAVCCPQE